MGAIAFIIIFPAYNLELFYLIFMGGIILTNILFLCLLVDIYSFKSKKPFIPGWVPEMAWVKPQSRLISCSGLPEPPQMLFSDQDWDVLWRHRKARNMEVFIKGKTGKNRRILQQNVEGWWNPPPEGYKRSKSFTRWLGRWVRRQKAHSDQSKSERDLGPASHDWGHRCWGNRNSC